MFNGAQNEAWKMAIGWHGVAMLPVLRAMTREQVLAVAKQAGDHSLAEPLHYFPAERKYLVPLWKERPLSGAECTALMVFGLWVLCGEDEGMASGLMNDWGGAIKHAVYLTRDAEGNREIGRYQPPAPAEPDAPPQGNLFD